MSTTSTHTSTRTANTTRTMTNGTTTMTTLPGGGRKTARVPLPSVPVLAGCTDVDLPVWGPRVRLERMARGLTQAEFGRSVGISRDTVARIESGWRGLSDELRIDIAEKFSLPPETLFPYERERRKRRRAGDAATT